MSKLKISLVILAIVGLGFGIYQSGLISKVTKREAGKKISTLTPKDEKVLAPSVYYMA